MTFPLTERDSPVDDVDRGLHVPRLTKHVGADGNHFDIVRKAVLERVEHSLSSFAMPVIAKGEPRQAQLHGLRNEAPAEPGLLRREPRLNPRRATRFTGRDQRGLLSGKRIDMGDRAMQPFRHIGFLHETIVQDRTVEPVAEVVEKLKYKQNAANDILDNLRGVDIEEYINQAKRIDWKQLLDAAEEILGFIQARPKAEPVITTNDIMQNISLPETIQIEELEEDWPEEEEEYVPDWEDEEDELELPEPEEDEEYIPPEPILSLKRNKTPTLRRR